MGWEETSMTGPSNGDCANSEINFETTQSDPSNSRPGTEANKREAVVLIHGLGSHWALMQILRWRLNRAGFATFNWGYRSWRRDIETHADAFSMWLSSLEQTKQFDGIHIVAHSLGSIITRCMLVKHRFSSLRRIVMLCPPNRGSHMATTVAPLLPQSFQTLRQIADSKESWVNRLPQTIPVETGIIVAGGDRVVHRAATRIDSVTAYTEVPGMHTAVLFRRRVADLCVQFLRTGSFISESLEMTSKP